ncbi:MAG: toll/interleukin-1 receptor domain-containing protein [Anaerolineae bacterium]|nr:toll/interleukin-1 receptor domain-containing protein [Anaerolineae bacterium]
MPSSPKPQIFISYSHEDSKFIDRLVNDLEILGANIWVDKNIRAGIPWGNAIQQGLDTSEVMLLVISPDSMNSPNVEREWQYFLVNDKSIIPICLKHAKMHFQLANLQHINFCDQPYEQAFKQLKESLATQNVPLKPFLKPVAMASLDNPMVCQTVTIVIALLILTLAILLVGWNLVRDDENKPTQTYSMLPPSNTPTTIHTLTPISTPTNTLTVTYTPTPIFTHTNTSTVTYTPTPIPTVPTDTPTPSTAWISIDTADAQVTGRVGPAEFCNGDYKVALYAVDEGLYMWVAQPPATIGNQNIEIKPNCTWESPTKPWYMLAAHLVNDTYTIETIVNKLGCPPLDPLTNPQVLAASCFSQPD